MSSVASVLPTVPCASKAALRFGPGPYWRATGLSLLLIAVAGCSNPYKTAAKMGVRLVGQTVEDEDVKKKGQELVGRPVSAADQAFGQTTDVYKEVQGNRSWRAYPVKLDLLGKQRYVVAVVDGKIAVISKAEESERKTDIPRAIMLKEKVKGKSPRDCEANLGLGRPLITARSEKTQRLVQLYDASSMTDLGTQHYCLVRYGAGDTCDDLEFVAVGATTKGGS